MDPRHTDNIDIDIGISVSNDNPQDNISLPAVPKTCTPKWHEYLDFDSDCNRKIEALGSMDALWFWVFLLFIIFIPLVLVLICCCCKNKKEDRVVTVRRFYSTR